MGHYFCMMIYGELSWSATLKLNQDFNGNFGVTESKFLFNSTGNRVIYSGIFGPDNLKFICHFAQWPKSNTFERTLVFMGGVEQFSNTSDGKSVIYRAAKSGINRVELFSVPVEGGLVKN
ncbi:MAG: hypothetical protein R3F23_02295 [Verrucomicrobiia bacterium]